MGTKKGIRKKAKPFRHHVILSKGCKHDVPSITAVKSRSCSSIFLTAVLFYFLSSQDILSLSLKPPLAYVNRQRVFFCILFTSYCFCVLKNLLSPDTHQLSYIASRPALLYSLLHNLQSRPCTIRCKVTVPLWWNAPILFHCQQRHPGLYQP